MKERSLVIKTDTSCDCGITLVTHKDLRNYIHTVSQHTLNGMSMVLAVLPGSLQQASGAGRKSSSIAVVVPSWMGRRF